MILGLRKNETIQLRYYINTKVMTPQEKAKELISKMYQSPFVKKADAKRCAIISCDEILKEIMPIGARNGTERTKEIFWQQVKQAIIASQGE